MSDKSTIRPIKEIELEDIRTIIVSPKKIEYNKECIEDIKGILKKYIENKLKS